MYEELREAVCQANIELHSRKLAICTWGNVSGIDRAKGVVAIKPTGVSYDELAADKMVLLDLD
ncbi:MAG: class II aldolase/adducin family protein, partial [Planctomycetota bacterium]